MNFALLKKNFYKARQEKNALPRYIARRFLFGPFERMGLHILGDHFYEPIPNLRELESNYDDTPREIPGHPLQLADFVPAHVARLKRYGPEFKEEAAKFGFYFNTTGAESYFLGADAMSFYCLLRELKPASVVEIGQGGSTRVALAALERNGEEGAPASFLSIDPYSRLVGDTLKPKHTRFEQFLVPLQQVPVNDVLQRCVGNSLLFGDCSHVYKPGSDVWHLMHKIYPKLPVGCVLHIHDITLPHPWPKEFLIKNKWFWNEQDMLEQFLAFNQAFQIVLPVYWLHRDSPAVQQAVKEVAKDLFRRDLGFSFYIKRVA